ncbi:unnamed protein product [Prorocentrum cordatum]|uniref:Uncharacterized protein n=1 Tax=Prorocentrum cordatum TaxID=2364126 RepID=A0ABN9XI33_9DINO|nr:unnamed protein product [Polarella glacialis]
MPYPAAFPTALPTPSPTLSPTFLPGWPTPHPTFLPAAAMAGSMSGAGAAAAGDPRLQNAGKHVLINVPRGMGAEDALFRAQADARQLGGSCADMYFQEVDVTGSQGLGQRQIKLEAIITACRSLRTRLRNGSLWGYDSAQLN